MDHFSIELPQFDGYISENRFHCDQFSTKLSALRQMAPHSERARFAQQRFCEFIGILRCTEYREEHAGTALLHLRRRVEYIQRSVGQGALNDVTKNLRGAIVQ